MAKYKEEYQILSPTGDPVGPPQVFEAETKDELIEKLKAAHRNAASKFYEARRAAKLEGLLEPDPEQPIQTFEERTLSADDRVRLAREIGDPNKSLDATKSLIESIFGAPVEVIRENMREVELNKRSQFVAKQVTTFKLNHPEYVESDSNRDTLLKYLTKRNWPVTAKNLEIAFNDLTEDGLLILRAPEPTPVRVTEVVKAEPAVTTASAVVQPVSPVASEITTTAAAVTPISVQPADTNPGPSSTGLRRSDASVPQTTTAVTTVGITFAEINAMSSEQYAKRLATDPNFKNQVEALYSGKK